MINKEDPKLKINVRLFRKVQRMMVKFPKNVNMATYGKTLWGTVEFMMAPEKKTPDCGSAACLAGWTCALSLPNGLASVAYDSSVYSAARSLLGLTSRQAKNLFYNGYRSEDLSRVRASTVSRKIDRFLASGGLKY